MEQLLRGRHFLITGSNRGIGLAVARLLKAEGSVVIGLSRSKPEFKDLSVFHDYYECDFTNLLLLEKCLKNIIKEHPEIDGLVSNAGYGLFGSIENFSVTQIQDYLKANLGSHIVVSSLVAPLLKQKRYGDLIFMGSEAALSGSKNGSLYSASKFGLRGFSQAIREDCASRSIRVSIINPGFVRTEFFKDLDFEPASDNNAAIDPLCVASTVLNILVSARTSVIDEINLSPQSKNIVFKRNSD